MLQQTSIIVPLVIGYTFACFARSVHRVSADNIPEIITHWERDTTHYRLKHPNLESDSIFENYDAPYLLKHFLPDGLISARNETKQQFLGADLKVLLEELVQQLLKSNNKRTKFKHFVVLKQRDYNPRRHAGLIILKCTEIPVVVKLFMETPESFVSPFSKGFEPSVFFIMASTNRFLSGMLRIRNAEAIKKRILESPTWSQIVDVPRKWFWQPENQRWFRVTSNHLGKEAKTVVLPSMYAIICDAIEGDETFDIFNKEQRELAIELSHFLGVRIDPHIDNFMWEKDTHKLVIVDSEPFPVMVGLREPIVFNNYLEWYASLTCKCFYDGFLRTKNIRKAIHNSIAPPILRC